MSRKDYISDNLIHMRDLLKKYQKSENPVENTATGTAEKNVVVPESVPDTPVATPAPVSPPPAVDRQDKHRDSHHDDHHRKRHSEEDHHDSDHNFSKSLKKRHEEYVLSRRDLLHRLAEATGVLTENQSHYEILNDETAQLLDICNNMTTEIKALEIGNPETDNAAMGEVIRKIEHCRLEFIRQQARYKKLISHENHNANNGNNSGNSSVLPEISSMSFTQIIRFGFIFLLPVVIAFLLGSVILAVAIMFSMGGFNQG
jgi:hypothetical protein